VSRQSTVGWSVVAWYAVPLGSNPRIRLATLNYLTTEGAHCPAPLQPGSVNIPSFLERRGYQKSPNLVSNRLFPNKRTEIDTRNVPDTGSYT